MAFNSIKNYYEILDVDFAANNSDIKSAYRKLARKYHPDVNKDDDAIEIFKEITCAYETLSDTDKRMKYDIVHGIFKNENMSKESPETEEIKQTKKNDSKCNENLNDDHNDSQTFNKTRKHRNADNFFFGYVLKTVKYYVARIKKNSRVKEFSKPKKGENITTEVIITPEEAVYGGKRIINIRTTKTCPKCQGHRFTKGGMCTYCLGKGSVSETKKITVTIPKGVKDGAKLRLKGEGASGKNGGACGDVYIKIRIETKNQIHYDKLNIYYNIPITPFEAALGEEISIPAFDGTIKLKLPKNTCSGQKFRLAKQGIKKNGKMGDIIVTVSIEFSHDLSDDEIKLYEQLKHLSKDDVRKNFGYGS